MKYTSKCHGSVVLTVRKMPWVEIGQKFVRRLWDICCRRPRFDFHQLCLCEQSAIAVIKSIVMCVWTKFGVKVKNVFRPSSHLPSESIIAVSWIRMIF